MAKTKELTDEAGEKEKSPLEFPIWMWPIVPFVAIAGLILAVWQLPTIAYAAVTIQPAFELRSDGLLAVYFVALTALFLASWAWPFVALYLVSSIF
jgi:hypothetical protein